MGGCVREKVALMATDICQGEKQYCNCFPKPMSEWPFHVHLCRSFLDSISCHTSNCCGSLNFSYSFVLPKGGNSRIN